MGLKIVIEDSASELSDAIIKEIVEARSVPYRIEEREKARTKLTIENWARPNLVGFTRIIERTGYRFESKDIAPSIVDKACLDFVVRHSGLTEGDVHKVLVVLDLYSPYKAVKRYKVIPDLLSDVRHGSRLPDSGLRTFWYLDLDKIEQIASWKHGIGTGRIVGVKAKWIGSTVQGGYSSDGDYGYDYYPPYFQPTVYQQVYIVRDDWGRDHMVHPLDIEGYIKEA